MRARARSLSILMGAAVLAAGCAGDPQADLARLCAAADAACPSEGCPAGDALAQAWRRELARVAMDTEAGRSVRTVAYGAPLDRAEAAPRDAAVAAGLVWDCPSLARLEAAAQAAPPTAPVRSTAPPVPPGPGFAPAFEAAAALFGDDVDVDDVVTHLAQHVSRGEAQFAAIAAAALAPADPARDGADEVAAKALGGRLAQYCDRAGAKCGAAAQACVTLLSRIGPRNAAGHPALGDGRGRPMLLEEALRVLDHPEELDRRLANLPAPARARLHVALSGLLAAALGAEAPH